MKVLRSTLVIGLAAFVAACGDKVTVAGPTPADTAPKVNSVTVSPSSVTMNVNQTVSFTAIVDVSNNAATTVTWGPTTGPVTVSATGVATANAATPGVAVCATSTADATKKGCAQVVVTAAAPTIPATVSIQSITATGTNNVTVNPAAVAGAIDVRLNINPGNQTVTKVELKFGSTVVGSQTFTASQAAALRFAADEAAETQSTFPQILFTVNTAACTNATAGGASLVCGAAGSTTTPVFTNGSYTMSAQLTVSGQTAGPSATAQTQLTLVNADGWVWSAGTGATAQGTSGTTANAFNATGFRYDRGGLTMNAALVSYTGVAAHPTTPGTMSFGSACDASGGGVAGVRTVTLTGTGPFTGTFSATAAAAAGNVTGYEFDAGLCGLNAVGETPTVTMVNANGDALFAAAAPLNIGAVTGLRLDNRAPLNPTLIQNPRLRANGWVNAEILLTTNNGAGTAVNGVMVAPAVQAGCSAPARTDCGITTTARFVRTAVSAAGTVSEARSATASSTPTLPAPSITNTTYCGIFTVQDALGNEAALPAAATVCSAPAALASTALAANHMLFGVDIAQPTAAYTGASIANNSRRNAGTMAGEFILTVNDTGLVGNSGMLPTSPVLMLLSRRAAGAVANSAGTTTTFDATGAGAAAALTATGVAAAAPLYSTAFTGITGAANHAYWTHSSRATDAAGNSTDPTPRITLYDATAPVPGAPSAAVTLTATGYSASAFVSEDLDIQDYSFGVNFGALAPFTPATAQLQQPVVAVNGYNAATFANTNYGVSTTVPLPLALQANVAAGLTNMAALNTTARSQGNLSATSGNFVPGVVTPGAAIPFGAPQLTTFPAIVGTTAAAWGGGAGTGLVTGNTTAASATSTGVFQTNVTATATITGSTAVFNNPFSRVDFYMLDATLTRYFNVGSATAATLNDNGVTRTFTFAVTINGPTVYALLGGAGATWASNVVAVGIGAANGNIGMVAAGATAINVVF